MLSIIDGAEIRVKLPSVIYPAGGLRKLWVLPLLRIVLRQVRNEG